MYFKLVEEGELKGGLMTTAIFCVTGVMITGYGTLSYLDSS